MLPPPHAVPFASVKNAVELELGVPDGTAFGAEALTVSVAAAPDWLRFSEAAVAATADDGAGPLARLAFDVDRAAPVGRPAEVAFEVRAGGALVATHTLRLQVAAPVALTLGLPYPNPARGAVTVPFEVPTAGPVRLVAYDVLGREVAVLAEGEHELGAYEGRLESDALAAGTYVVRLAGTGADGLAFQVRRLTVVR